MEEKLRLIQKQIMLLTQKILSLIKHKPAIVEPEEKVIEVIEPDVEDKDMSAWINQISIAHQGRDMAKTEDILGCVEAVREILRRAGVIIGGGKSTAEFYKKLEESEMFERTNTPLAEVEAGTVVVCATGQGTGRGHAWIASDGDRLFSNNSKTGLWDNHWTKDAIYKEFSVNRNFPIFCYRYKS